MNDRGDNVIGDESNENMISSSNLNAKVMNTSEDVPIEACSESEGQSKIMNGGSMLGVIDDIICVGQAMGYAMEGSVKDMEHIIGMTGANLGFK